MHDSGAGFPDDQVDRIFEPYVTSKVKGTGLGLAIAKKIVEEHGGVISGCNAQEGGARIAVLLPTADADPAPDGDACALRPNF